MEFENRNKKIEAIFEQLCHHTEPSMTVFTHYLLKEIVIQSHTYSYTKLYTSNTQQLPPAN